MLTLHSTVVFGLIGLLTSCALFVPKESGDEYRLTFDRLRILREWTHQSYVGGGELMPARSTRLVSRSCHCEWSAKISTNGCQRSRNGWISRLR